MTDLINLEDLKDLPPEDLEQKIQEANEAHNKRLADATKWVETIAEQKKLTDNAIEALAEINGDNTKLVQLNEKDPKLAQYILEKVFPWKTIEDFKDKDGSVSPKGLTKDQLDEYYEEKKIEEKIEKITSKMSDDDKTAFLAELKGLPKLNKDNADKYIKIALREVQPDYSDRENEARATSMGGGVSQAQGETGAKGDKATLDHLTAYGHITPAKKTK